jgi:hypothetical protein
VALIEEPAGAVSARESASPFRVRIQTFDLIRRHDFDLWLPVPKSDCASYADDFPLDHSKSLIWGYLGPGRNEPSELLIGIFSSEIDKCRPKWASRHRDDLAPQKHR